MPSDHLACRVDAYEGLSEQNRRILDVAMQKLSFRLTMAMDVENLKAKAALEAKGVTIHDWSPADRASFRQSAQAAWQGWADKTPEARALVDSHMAFLDQLGLVAE
jgi:TRAP-type C4-dicarboxylate transport system substrate-binding protein